ncbi:MAG: hypothetical protein RR497_06795 [Oscillospiraceae bacterium]
MKDIKMVPSSMSQALAQIDELEELSPKDKGCLRLLTEEMFSMCKELLSTDTLDFALKREDGCCVLCVRTKTQVNETAKEQFLSVSSDGKNAANQGLKGVLVSVLEAFSYNSNPALYGASWACGMQPMTGRYPLVWTLSQYMETAPSEKIHADWDGMEKSIIANFADDVSIGVRNNKLEMTVTKSIK